MSDDAQTTTATTTTADTTGQNAEFYKAEAQKAFKDRDAAKQKIRDLEAKGLIVSEEQIARLKELEDAAAKAEEDKKRKAGEFDSLREQMTKKHAAELQAERERVTKAETRLHRTLISREFAAASDLFASDGKTVLPADVAETYFARFVSVQDDDAGDLRVVVKGHDGQVILDAATGQPASFSAAIAEVIDGMPQEKKDRILRGSGKAGSGSSGGSNTPVHQADVTELTQRANRGDKAAIDALRQRRANSGGLVMGTAFSR